MEKKRQRATSRWLGGKPEKGEIRMKRWIAAFLLLCMLAGLLSACSPSGGDERTEPLTKDVSPQSYTETKDGVTLRVTVQKPGVQAGRYGRGGSGCDECERRDD